MRMAIRLGLEGLEKSKVDDATILRLASMREPEPRTYPPKKEEYMVMEDSPARKEKRKAG